MSILAAVSSILHPNQGNKSPSLGGNFAQILKSLWKSPNTSRDIQSATVLENGPNYDQIENQDNHLYDKYNLFMIKNMILLMKYNTIQ